MCRTTKFFHLIPSLSNYCHVQWTVGDSIYTGAAISHTFTKKGLYKIKVWGFAGNGLDSSEIFVSIDSIWKQDSITTEIQSYNISHELNIYPNPVMNMLEVDWKIPTNNANLQIFNADGRLLDIVELEAQETNRTIDVTKLPLGIYQVIFNIDGKIKTKGRFVRNEKIYSLINLN